MSQDQDRKPTIAVVGASEDRSKYGNKCVRAYLDAGYEVFPVNPNADTVEGLKAVARLAEIDVALDRISVYLPPAVTMEVLPEIAAAAAGDVYFNPGSADRRVLDAARDLGINALAACSIVAIGRSPAQYP